MLQLLLLLLLLLLLPLQLLARPKLLVPTPAVPLVEDEDLRLPKFEAVVFVAEPADWRFVVAAVDSCLLLLVSVCPLLMLESKPPPNLSWAVRSDEMCSL